MDFSYYNPLTSNALNLAARQDDVKNVSRLLNIINPNCVDNRGWTCLHEAANSDSYDSVAAILKHPETRPLAETHEGHTALYLACRSQSSIETIKHLLENVEDIVNVSSTECVTPLHIASSQGRLDVMQLLIDFGALTDLKDCDGDTPMHEACLANHAEAVTLLLKAGANPRIQNEQLFTPLHIACSSGCFETVKNLLPYADDINQRISSGETPLMVALHDHSISVVYYLLDKGANPNLKNFEEKVALDIALDLGYSSVFKRLLRVTDEDAINANIICRACKPHYFTYEILEILLTSNLGPKFFEYSEKCSTSAEPVWICDFVPSYRTHAPLNSYLSICEYMFNMCPDKFREFFYLFLKRGVSVNAKIPTELPPLIAIHHCAHSLCFEEVLEILVQHGCNIDYCSSKDQDHIPDAFLASLTLDPCTAPIMIPYSLFCDPGYILKFAANHGVLNRMPMHVQNKLLSMIVNYDLSVETPMSIRMLTLKHLSRLKVRDIIRKLNGRKITTKQFLDIINNLPLPFIIKKYLRFIY